MSWKGFLRDYFTFNKRERRGLTVLISVLVLIVAARFCLVFIDNQKQLSQADVAHLDSIASNIHDSRSDQYRSSLGHVGKNKVSKAEPLSIEWKSFNPNKADLDELMSLGLDSFIAQRVIKYRNKVKPFSSAEELYTIYDIDSNWVRQAIEHVKGLQPSVSKKQPKLFSEVKEVNPDPKPIESIVLIDINRADTQQLKSIPGVGSFYAKEIVELRKDLGGFIRYDQLMGIYKIREHTLDALAKHAFIDTSGVRRIDLNSCTLKQLGRHPYLTWRQARTIINYRENHGLFANPAEILETDVIPDSVYAKIAPYLAAQ